MTRTLASLSSLQARFREAQDVVSLAALRDDLCEDSRVGAVALAERCVRRMVKLEAEQVRLRGLFEMRAALVANGARYVAGVDEVGVGPLVGPVVAAAVILPEQVHLPGLNDSKKLSAGVREKLDRAIREQAVAFSVAEVDPPTIDRLNIYHAALEAMRRAVMGLGLAPDHLLVDARTIPGTKVPQTPVVGGDAKDASIAAASIVAKVHRDGLMRVLHARFPEYGFDRNMGYPTQEHREALARFGALSEHRKSFGPVAESPLRPVT